MRKNRDALDPAFLEQCKLWEAISEEEAAYPSVRRPSIDLAAPVYSFASSTMQRRPSAGLAAPTSSSLPRKSKSSADPVPASSLPFPTTILPRYEDPAESSSLPRKSKSSADPVPAYSLPFPTTSLPRYEDPEASSSLPRKSSVVPGSLPASSMPFPTAGLTLLGLRDFVEMHGGAGAFSAFASLISLSFSFSPPRLLSRASSRSSLRHPINTSHHITPHHKPQSSPRPSASSPPSASACSRGTA
jgi:hypothetical protein